MGARHYTRNNQHYDITGPNGAILDIEIDLHESK